MAIQSFKSSGVIQFRDFNIEEARKCNVSPDVPNLRRLTYQRVPNLAPSDRNDLHRNLGAEVPVHSSVYDIQELDNHSHRIWRGAMVRGFSYAHYALLLRPHGTQLHRGCVG